MAFSGTSGVFTAPNTVSGTVDVTCGFQPKAILFYSVNRTDASDAVGASNRNTSIGVGTSHTNRYAICSAATDDAASSDGSKRMTNAAIITTLTIDAGGGTGSVDGALDLDDTANWPSDGFRVICDEVFAAGALKVGYVAWGGTDITNATIVEFQEPGATGTQDITSPGFTASDGNGVVIFISFQDQTAPPASQFTRAGKIMIGAATSSTKQAVLESYDDQGVTSMDCRTHCSSAYCVAMSPDTGDAVDARATFNGWITNGFQLNWAERANTRYIAALVIKGGKWEVGNFLTQTDTSTQIVESGFGFQPVVVGPICSGGSSETGADVVHADDIAYIGAFTSTSNRHCQGHRAQDGVGNENINSFIEYDACYANVSTGGIIGSLADVVSVDSGGFTLIMDDADTSQVFCWYVAAGSSAVEKTFAANLTATADLTANATAERPIAAALSATGDMTSALRAERPIASSLVADANVTTSLSASRDLAAALTTTADLSAAATFERGISALLQADADLAAHVTAERPLSASLSANADLTTLLGAERPLGASLQATSDLSALLNAERGISSSLVADANLDVSVTILGQVTFAAALLATADVEALVTVERDLSASITGDANLAADLDAERPLSASLAADASFSVLANVERPISAALVADANLDAAITIEGQVSYEALLTATADIASALAVERPIASALSADANLQALLGRERSVSAALTADSNLTGLITVERGFGCVLVSDGNMLAHAACERPFSADVVSLAELLADINVTNIPEFVPGLKEIWRPEGGRTWKPQSPGRTWKPEGGRTFTFE